jgi:hypothetical protein
MAAACGELRRRGIAVSRVSIPSVVPGRSHIGWSVGGADEDVHRPGGDEGAAVTQSVGVVPQ